MQLMQCTSLPQTENTRYTYIESKGYLRIVSNQHCAIYMRICRASLHELHNGLVDMTDPQLPALHPKPCRCWAYSTGLTEAGRQDQMTWGWTADPRPHIGPGMGQARGYPWSRYQMYLHRPIPALFIQYRFSATHTHGTAPCRFENTPAFPRGSTLSLESKAGCLCAVRERTFSTSMPNMARPARLRTNSIDSAYR